MAARADLSRVRVDTLDDVQPLGRHLVLVFREFELEVVAALHRAGYDDLSESDLAMLRFIDPSGSRAVDVARLAGITKQGAGKALRSLEERGYLARRDDAHDSRAWRIGFTRKGEGMIRIAIDEIRRIERRYVRLLGARRLREMKHSLRALFADHCDRREKVSP
jgi:DNA-binding MarR family transcriptional regulator